MLNQTKNIIKKISDLDAHTMGVFAILIVAFSVTYSSAKIIHKNFLLEQEITKLRQQNSLQEQLNKNQELKNQYYKTDAYLDLAARKYFNKASPGETVILVPKEVADSYIVARSTNPAPEPNGSTPKFIENWKEWIDFLRGRPIGGES